MELFGEQSLVMPRQGPVRTILVVDDSRTNLAVLGKRLGHLGYLAVLCDNGAEALDLIAARGFDLVLLDMVMPMMSGMHVLREIRGSRETSDLPVIMLTGRSDPAAAVEALAAGADDHVAKPFVFEVLHARIERVLARARRIAELQRSNATLDARIATRAMELGEARTELAATRADRQRLVASIQALNDQIERLSPETSGVA
ncbi:response regulator [Sphingomonas sp. AR_OL41]|jgi:DNA-binding response OmpR family regulator|uniref:response regulator n=1 Tax=Sphingomonas sp. AR_OL41 TaxID=3042729 RepID=UPI00247FDDF3|nr:response regulator [Sphingomonas sp. AR_OL41]MDH7972055.1 response regulator [Sphingomonas sp. AR_OL41]